MRSLYLTTLGIACAVLLFTAPWWMQRSERKTACESLSTRDVNELLDAAQIVSTRAVSGDRAAYVISAAAAEIRARQLMQGH